MAAIVYLDVDDEITSAAARIRTLDDARIALVLPLGSRLATSRINFRLLAREGEARDKQVEVVTNDPSARALASSAGLRTYVSVAAFEAGTDAAAMAPAADRGGASSPASPPPASSPPGPPASFVDDSPTVAMPVIRPPRERADPVPFAGREIPRRRWPWVVGALVVGAVLAASGLAAFVLLPSAQITLVPATDDIGPIRLSVTAQAGVTEPDPVNLLVPATTFTFDMAASDTFPATGVRVTETKASGEVTFANCDTSERVRIRAGSIVSTDGGVAFRTLEDVTLEKARFFPPSCPGGTVAIEAVEPGTAGNVGAGQIDQIPPGYSEELLLVSNEQPTTGGTHEEAPQVQASDVDAAMLALESEIAASFDEQVTQAEGVPEGTTLFPETKQLGARTPTVDPLTLVGQEIAEFELGLAAEGTAIGVDPAPVETLADARVRTAVADGFRLIEDSIDVTVGDPIVAGTTVSFPATVRALQVRIVDEDQVLDRIRGLALPQARTVLSQYGEATIAVWPDWVTTIPDGDGRATLTIQEPPSTSASPSTPASQPPSAPASSSPGP